MDFFLSEATHFGLEDLQHFLQNQIPNSSHTNGVLHTPHLGGNFYTQSPSPSERPASSPSSSSSSLRSPMPNTTEPATSITVVDARINSSRHERRKAQNRDSQRAFRDRKNRELSVLLANIPRLEDQHRVLLESYSRQSTELCGLREQIEELSSKMNAIFMYFNVPLLERFGLDHSGAGGTIEEDISFGSRDP